MSIGFTYNNDWVLASNLFDINESFSCWYIVSDFPRQFYVCFLHLFFESFHCIVISCLSKELTKACQFSNGNCLIGSFSTVCSHVSRCLNGFSRYWDVMDVHEVVSVGTSTNTNFLVSLHKDTKFINNQKFNLKP